ncbi:MAG: hypothetical protein ACLQOO_33385 [Terriglobia bacterium]
MSIPPEFRRDADQFPPLLRALLEAELAAGNSVAEVGHTFPTPPAGAYFKLAAPVSTRSHESGGGLTFRALNNSLYFGFFGDDRGFYFIVEPPLPPPPEPDMDAIRAAHAPKSSPPLFESDPNTAPGRFERSMVMNYEKWHDGIGYDLEAIGSATQAERRQIETLLLVHGIQDWRDLQALAALDTPLANEALQAALRHPHPEIRLAVARYTPRLVPEKERIASLVEALQTAVMKSGLSQALDEAAQFHPKEVVEALLRGVCIAKARPRSISQRSSCLSTTGRLVPLIGIGGPFSSASTPKTGARAKRPSGSCAKRSESMIRSIYELA